MKILVISNLYPPHNVGGYEVRCRQVVDRLIMRGHGVHVLTSNHRKAGVDDVEEPHVQRALRIHGFFNHPWLPIWKLYRLERDNHDVLASTLKHFSPDVVHVWNMGGISKSLLHRLERGAVPVVYDVSDHWIARSLKADVWLSWWNESGSLFRSIGRSFLAAIGVRKWIDRKVPTSSWEILKFKRIYFCSAFLRGLTAKAGFNVEHGEVIYCGIETALFEKRTDWLSFDKLLWVGRMNEDKDPLTAIRALGEAHAQGLTNLSLHLYGHGDADYMTMLQAEISELGLGNSIEFRSVSATEMPKVYAEYDALLFTSNWGEPFALTPLEAMAAGVPVILCPDGGDAELGQDRKNCILAKAGEPVSLASALSVLDADEPLRVSIAQTARKQIVSSFDLEKITQEIDSYLVDSL
ncbi:glycosyltransferase family 4 protein [Rubellicoccus peritrichatus]|uniref:Glycosyltransferase family 4 protein n=1 Tax=Rubellicoccus peritrichatus TaxID=3080537 RepID=A0AAQ3LH17_9BACT|nr:glycosyltransferase family 4 protein [Puniceicoccus sp. CR14]WOO42004.1 glycosyltransferase family 4 protein [Puniceicoccus sp. CR14]